MAISLNGYVADESGSEDFISHANWETFCALAREKGSFIIGRKTLDAVKNWDVDYGFDDLADVTRVVLTSGANSLPEGYIVASSPQHALQIVGHQGKKFALITGGPTVNSSFMKERLVDEIVFNIEPVVIGKGKSVFTPESFQANLEFNSVKELADGIIQVRYKVKKRSLPRHLIKEKEGALKTL